MANLRQAPKCLKQYKDQNQNLNPLPRAYLDQFRVHMISASPPGETHNIKKSLLGTDRWTGEQKAMRSDIIKMEWIYYELMIMSLI